MTDDGNKKPSSNLVQFDALDLADILLRADRIFAIRSVLPSAKEKLYGLTRFEGAYLGQMGEKAVEKFFGIAPHLRLEAGGDGGVDHIINGWQTQTKLSTYQGREPELKFETLEFFSADVAIVVRLLGPVAAEVIGCITKQKFMRVYKVKNYGYGDHFVCSESELSDPNIIVTSPARVSTNG
jgi:hypothetical protein